VTAPSNRTLHGPDYPAGRTTLVRDTPPPDETRPSLRFREQPDHDGKDGHSDTVWTHRTRIQPEQRLDDVIRALEQRAPNTETHAHAYRAASARRRLYPPHQRAAEQAFLSWLVAPTSADELPLVDGGEPEPLARILVELSLSSRVLPTETAASLGLRDGTTIGHAAVEVLLAVKDPAGPRCRSYRAAVFFLRDLDRD